MTMPRRFALGCCVTILIAGCGDRSAPRPTPGTTRPADEKPAATAPTSPATARSPAPTPPQTAPAATRPTTRPTTAPAPPAAIQPVLDRIERLERGGQLAEAWRLALEARSTFAGHPRRDELRAILGRLRQEKRQAAQFSQALRLLDSETVEAAQIASAELAEGGKVVGILLRKALPDASDRALPRIVDLLVRIKDPHAPAALHQHARAAKDPNRGDVLWTGLERLAGQAEPRLLRDLYHATRGETFAACRRPVGVLAAALRDAAGGDPNAFGELVGDADAVKKLKQKVSAALTSKDAEIAKAAAVAVEAFGMTRPGLVGQYYHGKNFDKPVLQHLDPNVNFPPNKLPLPDNRITNFSVRWTARFRAPAAGKYTFYVTTDDGARLWVGEKKILESWTDQSAAEYSGTVELKPGMHPLKLEHFQGEGEYKISIEFQGPGIARQLLGGKYAFAPPKVAEDED